MTFWAVGHPLALYQCRMQRSSVNDCLRCLRQHKSLKANSRYFSALGPPFPPPRLTKWLWRGCCWLRRRFKNDLRTNKEIVSEKQKNMTLLKSCNYYFSRKWVGFQPLCGKRFVPAIPTTISLFLLVFFRSRSTEIMREISNFIEIFRYF